MAGQALGNFLQKAVATANGRAAASTMSISLSVNFSGVMFPAVSLRVKAALPVRGWRRRQ